MAVTVIRDHSGASGAPNTADRFEGADAFIVDKESGILSVRSVPGSSGRTIAAYASGQWRSVHVGDSLAFLNGQREILGT